MPLVEAAPQDKIRVYEAARQVGISSKEFLDLLHELEHYEYTHHTNVLADPEIVDHVREVVKTKYAG
ncbi:MAG: hypothetical protein AAF267_17660 [Deinococcota bacterium]